MCPMPLSPVPTWGQLPRGEVASDARSAAPLVSPTGAGRPQVWSALVLVWMPEIPRPAPLDLRYPQSGPHHRWGRPENRAKELAALVLCFFKSGHTTQALRAN